MERKYDLKTLLSVLKTDTIELIHTKIELLKLETVEKISRTGSLLIYGLIIMNLLFFALLFAFIAFGFLIGDWLQSIAAGFAIVTSIYIVILVILLSCRKSILTKIQNMFLKELEKDLENGKKQLQVKSGELTDALDDNFEYLQKNFVPLASNCALDAVMGGLSDILPFFLKGKKGLIAGLLLKMIGRA